MRRRQLVVQGVAAGAAVVGLAPSVRAQASFTEGRDYKRLAIPVPPAVPGKVEVVEFFGYWCPHCAEFEPALEAWLAKLPPQASFRRVPVGATAIQQTLQRLYFALESLGVPLAVHGQVFQAIHARRVSMTKDAEITAFAQAHGLDGTKLLEAMKSFSVAGKLAQARQQAQAFEVEFIPTLAVDGRFTTTVDQAGGAARALQLLTQLINSPRKG